ncbi:class F sortase [Streptomyces sp. Vc74B-19]|uniref:class F sortase n=2 Tax=Streptomyces TaxID=1883 RepID=UPI001BFC9E07|nr:MULTISPECIES: class F sortase [unclassified Streptomyces]MBT3162346.1 class F sortase [Streptomyces sp. Vc74B-19]MCO4696161.1 class F sortase [Streptomyces sp. RO-S4]MDU0301027.1 class F sortase [Streptomyces sp. PAL114]
MPASPPTPDRTDPASPLRRRLRAVMTAVFWGGAGLLLATTLMGGGEDPPDDAHGPHASRAVATAPSAEASTGPAESGPAPSESPAKQLPRARPTRLQIPSIGVDAPFTALAINSKGQLEAPPAQNTNLVGWYAKGVSPGELGTAIVAGHVDTATSAAVFARLGELEKGDRFRVQRADGTTATFVVDETESFAKDDFPDERVYADTPDAQVRLITCAGDYDRTAKDYTENLVVFAHLV